MSESAASHQNPPIAPEEKSPNPFLPRGTSIMVEFFKGWRRKIGCVTLLMALVFMAGWLRNYFIRDSVQYSNGAFVVASNSFPGWQCPWISLRMWSSDS